MQKIKSRYEKYLKDIDETKIKPGSFTELYWGSEGISMKFVYLPAYDNHEENSIFFYKADKIKADKFYNQLKWAKYLAVYTAQKYGTWVRFVHEDKQEYNIMGWKLFDIE